MATRVFHLLINSFLSVTNRNFKLAFILGTFTDNALYAAKADPKILELYNEFHPVYTAFIAAYDTWKSQINTSISGTASFEQLLAQLTEKSNYWQSQALAFYKTKTDKGFIFLFPNGLRPFYTGGQLAEMNAVKTLSDGMANITGLVGVKADVDAFYALMVSAFNVHQGQKSNVGLGSDNVEAQREALSIGLFAAYGGLIHKYAATPLVIANFFDIESMQHNLQTQFVNNHLKALTTVNIFQRTLQPTDQIKIANNGKTELTFFWASTDEQSTAIVSVTVQPQTVETFEASKFGDLATNHFFNVTNPSDLAEGAYEVDLV
jgi:hypothetical protein